MRKAEKGAACSLRNCLRLDSSCNARPEEMWASDLARGEGRGEPAWGQKPPSHQPFPPPPSSLTSCVGSAVLGAWGFSPSLTDWETGLQGRTCPPGSNSALGHGNSIGTKLPYPLSLPVTTLQPMPSFKGGLSRNKHPQYFLDKPVGENESLSVRQLCQLASMSRTEEKRWGTRRDGGLGCCHCTTWDMGSHFSNPDLLFLTSAMGDRRSSKQTH